MKAKLVKENIGDILKGKELSGYLKEINDVKKLFKSISNVEYKLSLFKIDSTKNFSINFYPSSGISVSLLTPIIYKKEFNEKN